MSTEGIEQAGFGGAERTVPDVWEAFPREDYELLWERLDVLRPSQREEAALGLLVTTSSRPGVTIEEVLGGSQTHEASHMRARAACLLYDTLRISTVELGTVFNRSHSSIQRAMETYRSRPESAEELEPLRQRLESYPRMIEERSPAPAEPQGALPEKVEELAALAEEAEFLEELRPTLIRMIYPYHRNVDELLTALERLEAVAAKAYRSNQGYAGLDRRRSAAMAAARGVERMREAGLLSRRRGKVRSIPDHG
ncbi:MAG: hypothetical protein WED32_03815 [Patescibacteria group bacterium]